MTDEVITLIFENASGFILPGETESQHYTGKEFQTRVTEMDKITGYKDDKAFLLIEIPVYPKEMETVFPFLKNNYYCKRAYPIQNEEATNLHKKYIDELKIKYPNIYVLGRLGNFKYWGMAETLKAAIDLGKELSKNENSS